jgi:hypothetical protein
MKPSRIPCCLLAGLAAAIALAGCTSHDLVASATRPGKYRLYSCEQLNKRGTELVKRERELEGLIKKAGQSPGGELVAAVAYRNEYNTAQGDLREIEKDGAEKKCVLKYRTVSDRVVR